MIEALQPNDCSGCGGFQIAFTRGETGGYLLFEW